MIEDMREAQDAPKVPIVSCILYTTLQESRTMHVAELTDNFLFSRTARTEGMSLKKRTMTMLLTQRDVCMKQQHRTIDNTRYTFLQQRQQQRNDDTTFSQKSFGV